MYAALARGVGRSVIRHGLRTAPAYRYINRTREAALKYGAVGNEIFHMGYKGIKRLRRRIRRRGRRRMSRPTKRMRMTPSRRMLHFGEPPISKVICKRTQLETAGKTLVAEQNNQLNSNAITLFPARKDATNQQLYYRERDAIRFVGFRLNQYIRNTTALDLYVNVAIVCPKDLGSTSTAGLFRENLSTNNERAAALGSGGLGGMGAHFARINTDDYEVLFHKRYHLGPSQSSATIKADRPNYLRINRYFKINRKLTFSSGSDNLPQNGAMYLLRWYGNPGDLASKTPANVATEQHLITNFFRDMQG